MAASVSGFLGFALAKVVDQLWMPLTGSSCSREVGPHVNVEAASTATTTVIAEPKETFTQVPNEQPETSTPKTADPSVVIKPPQNKTRGHPRQTKAARRAANRRHHTKLAPVVDIKVPTYAEADADPVECASNASTCASSDEEEEEVEDILENEMRLMRERAEQIKRLAKQSRQPRSTRTKATPPTPTKAKEPVRARVPDICSPIRLQNNTKGLWKWSVFAGFSADRRPQYSMAPHRRALRAIFCDVDDSEALDDQEMLESLALQLLKC